MSSEHLAFHEPRHFFKARQFSQMPARSAQKGKEYRRQGGRGGGDGGGGARGEGGVSEGGAIYKRPKVHTFL